MFDEMVEFIIIQITTCIYKLQIKIGIELNVACSYFYYIKHDSFDLNRDQIAAAHIISTSYSCDEQMSLHKFILFVSPIHR